MSPRNLSIAFLLAALPACALPPVPEDRSDDSSGTTTSPPTAPPDEIDECIQLSASVEGLLRDKCGKCHDSGQTLGGVGTISNLDGLIEDGLVVREDASSSLLVDVVESERMPQGGPPLSAAEIDTITQWIDTCTSIGGGNEDPSLLERPACPDNAILSHKDILQAIRADLGTLDSERVKTTRYISFAHLHSAGYCEPQLEGYRHALAKLINHLSQAPEIRVPVAIDAARTIYRIDLVDYEWSTETWSSITASDPYAVKLLQDDARTIQDQTDTELFLVMGDWFIDAASQPELYHTILELPDNRFELEASLGVDVDANIADELARDDDDVLRAGFQISKVSDFNRVIERHQIPSAPYRAYWLSYDFASNSGDQSIFDRPLDFVEDGGEIIFTLPNGLQGYMLVDAVGDRIELGPEQIVRDREVPEEPIVINGLSCMSCHSEGMRLAKDEVDAFVQTVGTELSADQREQVSRLYAPADVFERAQQRDVETFANALAQTGAPRRVGSHEPVMAAHLAFEEPLDLRRAAAEFGVTEDQLKFRIGELVGISQLAGTTVDRETFEANFAENACLLKLGETVECPGDLAPG